MGAASRASVAVTGALTTVLVARLLGPSGAGAFSIALTIVYVLLVLTTFGIEHGIAYYVSSRRWGPGDAFRVSQRLAVRIGLPAAVIAVGARLAVPSAFGGLSVAECAVAAASAPFTLAWFYGSFVALADDHYEGYVLPPAMQSAGLLVLAAALAVPFGIAGAVAAILASHVVVGVTTVAWGRRRLRRAGEAPPEPGQLRRALAFGIKGYAANSLQVLIYRVDFFVLSAVGTTAALGHYSIAVAVTTVLWLLPQALSDVLYPRVAALSHAEHADAEAQRAFVEAKSLRHTSAIVIVSTVVLVGALLVLVVPIYGPDFRDSVTLGLIRLPGVALLGIAATLSATIVGRGHPEYGLYIALVTTPLTMALYATLIPWLKAPGAALASSLSFTLSFFLAAFFYRRATGAGVARRLIPTRSELDDYRTLLPKVREWAAGLRQRRSAT
jgi:O-antigen/teichoic acid export membrane protein